MITLFMLLCLLPLSFYAGGYVSREKNNKRPEPPILDTPENILDYLEACTLAQDNESSLRLLCQFRSFTNKDTKQLSATSTSSNKPDWYHSNNVSMPPEKHWEVFLEDFRREKEAKDKIEVIKHWMIDTKNLFTMSEMNLILNEIENSEDRREIRNIYAESRKQKNVQKTT